MPSRPLLQPLLSKDEAGGEDEAATRSATAPGAAPAEPQSVASGGQAEAADEHDGSGSLLAVGTPEQREAEAVIAAATAAATAAAAAAVPAEGAAAAAAVVSQPKRSAVVLPHDTGLVQQADQQAAAAEGAASGSAAAAEEASAAETAAAVPQAALQAAAAAEDAVAVAERGGADQAAGAGLAAAAAVEHAAPAVELLAAAERQQGAALLPAVLTMAEPPAAEAAWEEVAELELPAALLELPVEQPREAQPAGLAVVARSSELSGASSAGASIDPSDVAPGALGSPFVPPWLTPAQGGQSSKHRTPPPMPFVAAASLGFPAMGQGQSAEAALDAAAAALAECASGGGNGGSNGGSGGDGASPGSKAFAAQGSDAFGARPRHSRNRSLLSESLEDDRGDAAPVGPAECAQHGPALGELGAEPMEPPFAAGVWQMPADVPAMDAAAAAAAAAAAHTAASLAAAGRPSGLRVELPDALEAQWEAQQQQQWQQQQQGAPSPAAQQTPPPADTPGTRGAPTPLGFAQQQALAAAAAAEAAAAAAALQAQQQREQQPAGDSVAAALQRAVDLANARPSSLSGGFAGFQSAPPGQAGAQAQQLRATLSGGTFRAAAPPGLGPGGAYPASASMPLPGFSSSGGGGPAGRYGGPGLPHEGGDSAWGDFGGMGFSMLAERSSSSRSDRHLPRVSSYSPWRRCLACGLIGLVFVAAVHGRGFAYRGAPLLTIARCSCLKRRRVCAPF